MANGGSIKYTVGFNVDKSGLNQLKASLQELKQMTAADLIKINPGFANTAQAEIQKIRGSIGELETALNKAFNTNLGTLNISKFNQELKKLNLNAIYADMSKLGAAGQNAFRNTTAQILTTNMQLKQTHSLINNMATTMANTVKWGVASSIMNGFTRSVQQAYSYVKRLDTSLNDIRIVTGKSADEMERFATKANNAAKALGQSTTNYTEASLIYYQQGLSDKEVAARAETTLKAANVTGQTGEEVSEQLTAVWNGYKVSAEEAELYVDKLAAVASRTASNLEELSTGMSKVASAANAMGVDADQLNAQLATIVSVTRQAPESVGTALKTIYARMSDLKLGGTDEDGLGLGDVSGQMEAMGIDVLDATGNLRDMGAVIEDVAAKWDTWTEAQKTAMAQVMAGKRQYNNLVALFENWDMYEMALDTSQNSAGTLQKQQDTYMESMKAHLNQLKASTEDLYDSLLDPKGLNPLIDGLRLLTDLTSNFIDSIGGGGGLLLALGSIGTKVFSQQMANGIATFIVNMQSAKENASQLRAELEILRTIDTANLGNDQLNYLIEMKKQVLDLNKSITNEERNIANEYIKQQNELYKQQDALEARKRAAEETYARATGDTISLKGNYNATNLSNNLVSSAKEMETSYNPEANQQAKAAYEELTAAAQKYINVSNLTKSSNEEVKQSMNELEAAVEEHNEAVMKQLNAAEKVAASDDFEVSNKKELIVELEKLNKLRNQDGTLNLKNKRVVEQLARVEDARVGVYKKEAQTMRQTAEEIKNFAKETQNGADKAEQLKNSWSSFIHQIDLRSKIQQSIQLVSSFGQLASAINTISRIGSIWSNEDLTTGEKILQTVTNLGFAIPMLANSIGQVSKALGINASMTLATSKAQDAYIVSMAKRQGIEKSVLAQMKQGMSAESAYQIAMSKGNLTQQQRAALIKISNQLKKKEITTEQADIAVKEVLNAQNLKLSFSFKAAAASAKQFLLSLGPVGWAFLAIGAISGAIALIDKFTVSAKEAGENLLESVEKYKEFENELQSVENELQTTKDRIEELLKIADNGKLSITEEEELIRLEAQNIALEEQLELIKEKQALESRKVAQNAETAQEKGTYSTDSFSNNPFSMTDYYGAPEYAAASGIEASYIDPSTITQTYWDKGVSRKSLSTEGFEVQEGQIALDDISTFETWKKSMEELQQQALDNASKSEDGSKDELEWQEVADRIAQSIEDKEEYYDTQRAAYIDKLAEGFNAAQEALPSLRENNTDGQYDDVIKYYEDIVYNYKKQMGTLDATIEKTVDNLSLSENQKLNLQTSENVLDHENEKVNEDALEDIIGAENVEKLKIYSEELNLSMYDVVNRYQEMGELVGLSNEEIKQKLAEIRQEKIDDIVEQANEDYKGVAKTDLTSETFEAAGLTDEQIDNWEAVSQYLDETTLETKGWVEALKEAAGEYQKIEDAKNFETTTKDKASEYAEAYDIDEEAYKNLTETIHGNSEAFDELNEYVEANGEVAQEVAKDLMRYDKACEKVKDSSEDWMKALKSGNIQDQAEAINEMKDAYGNMLDIDGDSLSTDFLTNAENLRLMQEAAKGSEEAYNQLAEAAAKDILIQCGVDTTQFELDKAYIEGLVVNDTAFPDLEVGASLNDEAFLQELSNMVNAAGMTAEQATDYLSSMGVDAEVEEHTNSATETSEVNDIIPQVTSDPISYYNPVSGEEITSQVPTIKYTTERSPIKSEQEKKSFSLKVTSASKSSGGGFKYKNTSHGGGNKGKSSGKGGGGGSKPKKVDKVTSKKDRYHDVNVKLKQLDEDLEDIGRNQKKLFGADLLKALNKELDILEKQRDVLNDKLKIAKEERDELKKKLQDQGVQFNEDDTIKNYAKIVDEKEKALNQMIEDFNKLSAAEQEKQQEKLDQAKEDYEKFMEMIGEYEDVLLDTIPEIENQLDDVTDREIEIHIQKLNMEVELRLDLTQAQKDWNEFKREVIDGIDSDDIFGNAKADAELFNTLMGNQTTEALTHNINTTMDQIDSINKTGTSSIYGNDKNAALENLEEQMSNLMDHMTELNDLQKQISEAYLDMIDEVGEAFDEQIESYEYVGDLINHNMELIKLVKGEDAWADLQASSKQRNDNNLQMLAKQKAAVDYYRQMMETETDEEAKEKWTQMWKDGVTELKSLTQQTIEDALEDYEIAVNKIFDDLDDKMTNGKGLDYLTQEWELKNENADQYLDTINSTYEVQKLERKIQDSINNTDSLSAQKQLNKLMDDELKKLREKEKLTKYDIDRANAMYEIKLKEIALEEAQQNKSQMRLRRDASGNYSYQFVADQDSISKAQQELDDARNSLYNMDKDEYRENQQAILDVYTEFQEKMRDAANLSAEEKKLIEEQYNERINALLEENGYIRNNLMESTFNDLAALYGSDVANFQQMSAEEQDILMGQIVPTWNSGIQEMIDTMVGENGFGPSCKAAMEELNLATQEYDGLLAQIQVTAGETADQLSQGYDTNIDKAKELAEAQQANINNTIAEKDATLLLKEQVDALALSYKDVYDQAKLALEQAQKLRDHELEEAARKAAEEAGRDPNNNTPSGGNNPSGSETSNNPSSNNGKHQLTSDIIDGIAGAIWYWSPSAWGNGEERKNKINSKFGSGSYEKVQSYINDHVTVGGKMKKAFKYGWGDRDKYKQYYYSKFDTGGYTGDWAGNDGKAAILHKKELVLNANDTKNFLSAIHLVRDMESMLGALNDSMLSRTSGMTASLAPSLGFEDSAQNTVNQNVSIQASFPGVSSRAEIEDAFRNLVNIASQHAFNTQR